MRDSRAAGAQVRMSLPSLTPLDALFVAVVRLDRKSADLLNLDRTMRAVQSNRRF